MARRRRNETDSEEEEEEEDSFVVDDEEEEEEEDGEAQSETTYVAEHARSGRSQCRGCGQKIGNGVLRIGEESIDPFTQYNTTRWFHVNCISLPVNVEDIRGYSRLSAKDKATLGGGSGGGPKKKMRVEPSSSPTTSIPTKPSFPQPTFQAAAPFAWESQPVQSFHHDPHSHTAKPKPTGSALQGGIFAVHTGSDDSSFLKGKIESNSGRFSRKIDGDVTHVISNYNEVSKKVMMLPQLRQAIARKIPIVTESFLNDAVRQGRLPNPERYLLWHTTLDEPIAA